MVKLDRGLAIGAYCCSGVTNEDAVRLFPLAERPLNGLNYVFS